MNASFWNYPSKQKSWPIDEEMESLGEVIHPLDNIGGFDVRPGFYQMNGAYQTEEGVSFTVSSHGATSCVLLLFRPAAQEPYARIRIPESYKIGNTYSILVFGFIDKILSAFRFFSPVSLTGNSFRIWIKKRMFSVKQ